MKIGVLGGIGPEATGEFYIRLITKLQRSGLVKSNKDFPQIIINSIPAPELINDDIQEKELEHYIKGLKELEKLKVDFIVMICNTIYLYYKRLQEEIKIPILNLREEVRKRLKERNVKCILTIGSPATIKGGLYDFEGMTNFKLNKKEIKELSDSIFYFNRGLNKELQKNKIINMCKKYEKQGAELVLLGCTEFSLMMTDEKFRKIDTIDLLVDLTFKKITEHTK